MHSLVVGFRRGGFLLGVGFLISPHRSGSGRGGQAGHVVVDVDVLSRVLLGGDCVV